MVGFLDGYRESTQSWRELLLDLKARGLSVPPKLAFGNGAMVFKLIKAAEKSWRHLDGKNQLPKVITGAKFRDRLEWHDEIEKEAA